ncbi:MAG: hypothetical protein ACAI38_16940 [Myxococcota bacterium]|nr:hypothetical protein [Myxococcota bacterium]
MDAVCAIKLDLSPVAAQAAAEVEAARQDDSPEGKTITTAERDAIEQRTASAISAIGQAMQALPLECPRVAGGLVLQNARQTAKAIVNAIIDGPKAPPAPQQTPAPGPGERAPIRPRGRLMEA